MIAALPRLSYQTRTLLEIAFTGLVPAILVSEPLAHAIDFEMTGPSATSARDDRFRPLLTWVNVLT